MLGPCFKWKITSGIKSVLPLNLLTATRDFAHPFALKKARDRSLTARGHEEKMKIVLLLVFLCTFSGASMAYDRNAPPTAKDQTAAWWGHSPSHGHRNGGKTVRPHTGRRPISTHPARRRQF